MAKRRPNGAGTISRRKDGRYHGRAYVTDTDGSRRRVDRYGATYDEVDEKLSALKDQERGGVPVPSRSWKIGEWLTYWLREIVEPNTEHNTYAKYEGKVRLYLIPHLGTKSLTRLTPAQVRQALVAMKKNEVPAPTRQEVLRVLRNAINRARKEELVTRNVAELVDMPTADKPERKPWTAKEAIGFLKFARFHRLYAAFVLLLVLGLRRGEILGLRWQDIDFENEQFTPIYQVQRQKGKLVLKKLKTDSSQAPLPLPLFCATALRGRKLVQQQEMERAGERWHQAPGEDLIFTERHGGPIEPRGFSRTFDTLVSRAAEVVKIPLRPHVMAEDSGRSPDQLLSRATVKATEGSEQVGIRRITVRLARHTCGTLLAFLKVHPKVAQAILRHSQIRMTMDVYTQVVSEDQRAAADQLADLLNGEEMGPDTTTVVK
ncbi:tyrosine-type recombinase/integrase [Streptomyces xiamenensis]|uniref:tyrosine-type recombinase/integrase n=1 Tax=Streptomyces xiamenensis TaxID=408015 RepID=UPI0036C7D569